MHYEGLNLLNEKLRFPCSLRHKNRKKKKIKTAEREEQPGIDGGRRVVWIHRGGVACRQ